MRIFEPHAHMFSRVTDDYERMSMAGVVAILEPAFWLGQPRQRVGSFLDYFDTLVGWERWRASQFGIRHYCALALNPKEANDERVNAGVLAELPRYLEKDGVLAVGEVGYDDMTATEDRVFGEQIEMARKAGLPLLVHTPHRDKKKGVERTLSLVREHDFPVDRVLVDHNNEETVPLVVDTGCHMGFSIYPDTKMDEARMVAVLERYGTGRMIINSACDWGKSDPLKVPRTAALMRQRRFTADQIDEVVWRNPVAFFALSGRLDVAELESGFEPEREPFQGSTIQRGQPR